MNYIERALEKSGALWRAQEEALKKGLVRSAHGMLPQEDAALPRQMPRTENGAAFGTAAAQSETDTAQTDRSTGAEAEWAQMPSDVPRGEAGQRTEMLRVRLLQRLLGTQGTTHAPAQQETDAADTRRAERFLHAAAAEDGTAWLTQMLHANDAAGLSAAQEADAPAVRETVRDMQDAETLSRGLERDARRYDGGFLLY